LKNLKDLVDQKKAKEEKESVKVDTSSEDEGLKQIGF